MVWNPCHSSTMFSLMHQRQLEPLTPRKLFRAATGSRHFIQRLKLERKLDVHDGCVNTVCWNEDGTLLLSGSDDQHLVISNPFTGKIVAKIRSGHRSNIFSAKFLPASMDRELVSCSGSGEIFYTDVDREDTYGTNRFDCHFGTTYKILVVPNEAATFLSCGDDGTVRFFDLRVKISCTKFNCEEDVVINLRDSVSAMAVDPIVPFQMAVGSADGIVRIYDRRMLKVRESGGSSKGLISRFQPPSCASDKRHYRITSLNYRPRSHDVLVNYSSENIYLFNTYEMDVAHSTKSMSTGETMKTTSELNATRMSGGSSDSEPASSGATTGTSDNGHDASGAYKPIKRLRLRGDWSDTGPDARPESEDPAPTNMIMQRMSDLLTRMLNNHGGAAGGGGGLEEGGEQDSSEPPPPNSASVSRETTHHATSRPVAPSDSTSAAAMLRSVMLSSVTHRPALRRETAESERYSISSEGLVSAELSSQDYDSSDLVLADQNPPASSSQERSGERSVERSEEGDPGGGGGVGVKVHDEGERTERMERTAGVGGSYYCLAAKSVGNDDHVCEDLKCDCGLDLEGVEPRQEAEMEPSSSECSTVGRSIVAESFISGSRDVVESEKQTGLDNKPSLDSKICRTGEKDNDPLRELPRESERDVDSTVRSISPSERKNASTDHKVDHVVCVDSWQSRSQSEVTLSDLSLDAKSTSMTRGVSEQRATAISEKAVAGAKDPTARDAQVADSAEEKSRTCSGTCVGAEDPGGSSHSALCSRLRRSIGLAHSFSSFSERAIAEEGEFSSQDSSSSISQLTLDDVSRINSASTISPLHDRSSCESQYSDTTLSTKNSRDVNNIDIITPTPSGEGLDQKDEDLHGPCCTTSTAQTSEKERDRGFVDGRDKDIKDIRRAMHDSVAPLKKIECVATSVVTNRQAKVEPRPTEAVAIKFNLTDCDSSPVKMASVKGKGVGKSSVGKTRDSSDSSPSSHQHPMRIYSPYNSGNLAYSTPEDAQMDDIRMIPDLSDPSGESSPDREREDVRAGVVNISESSSAAGSLPQFRSAGKKTPGEEEVEVEERRSRPSSSHPSQSSQTSPFKVETRSESQSSQAPSSSDTDAAAAASMALDESHRPGTSSATPSNASSSEPARQRRSGYSLPPTGTFQLYAHSDDDDHDHDNSDDEDDAREKVNREGVDSDRRARAASKIQEAFRRRREAAEADRMKGLPQPRLHMKFSGHRNCRTMIKEANFYGDSFVVSGSDCGRMLLWDRLTGRLVMYLEADKHVVNCVQPNPVFPLIASSGIDYDVKLWAPMHQECQFDEDVAQMIVRRNELMLVETRDTITVPAAFMLRVLASLSQIRTGRSSSSAQSSQEPSSRD